MTGTRQHIPVSYTHLDVYKRQISYLDGDKPVWETFFTQDEANFRWRELGLFAGSNLDKDSGRLVARVVVDETKNDNITITLLWEFRINSI